MAVPRCTTLNGEAGRSAGNEGGGRPAFGDVRHHDREIPDQALGGEPGSDAWMCRKLREQLGDDGVAFVERGNDDCHRIAAERAISGSRRPRRIDGGDRALAERPVAEPRVPGGSRCSDERDDGDPDADPAAAWRRRSNLRAAFQKVFVGPVAWHVSLPSMTSDDASL